MKQQRKKYYVNRGKKSSTGAGWSNHREASIGDVALGHALRWRSPSRLVITPAAEEDDGGDRGRVLGVWPRRIGDQD